MHDPSTPAQPERCCPHCGCGLTLREAIIILRSSPKGIAEEFVRVRAKDGTEAVIEAGKVNPFVVVFVD